MKLSNQTSVLLFLISFPCSSILSLVTVAVTLAILLIYCSSSMWRISWIEMSSLSLRLSVSSRSSLHSQLLLFLLLAEVIEQAAVLVLRHSLRSWYLFGHTNSNKTK